MGDEWARILYSTSFVQKNRYILGSFVRLDLSDQGRRLMDNGLRG